MRKSIIKSIAYKTLKVAGITLLSYSTLSGIFAYNKINNIEKTQPDNTALLKQAENESLTAFGLSFGASSLILLSMALDKKLEKEEKSAENSSKAME